MNPITYSSLDPASIFCVGKNYHTHALEMAAWEQAAGNCADHHTREPVLFLKPGTALQKEPWTAIPLYRGKPIASDMQFEVELVLLIGKDACNVSGSQARSCIAAYGVGLDMTLRDLQLQSKKEGNPWLSSKGFMGSSPVSDMIPADTVGPEGELQVSLWLNGTRVQHGKAADMTWSPEALVTWISSIYGLRKGDMIFTGTPHGVGSVQPGDRLLMTLANAGGILSSREITVRKP